MHERAAVTRKAGENRIDPDGPRDRLWFTERIPLLHDTRRPHITN